jgi:probable phosphoglycerate mutase
VPAAQREICVSKLLLVRHGHVEGIAPERFRGRQDIPLSDLGRRQARAVATRIADQWHPTIVYTSPLGRCVETGRAIADVSCISSEPLENLNDLDYGAWQWKTYEDVRAQWPEEFAAWLKEPQSVHFPEGESLQDLSARVADALREILHQHANETVVAVGHDSSNRVLLLQLLQLPLSAYWRLSLDPGGLSEIDVSNDQVRIRRINETHYLR